MSDTTTHTNNSVPEQSPHLMTDNWDTGKSAESVEVISVDGNPVQLLINGEPFPYLLVEKPFSINRIGEQSDSPENTEWGTVTFTVFANKITETERPRSSSSRDRSPGSK